MLPHYHAVRALQEERYLQVMETEKRPSRDQDVHRRQRPAKPRLRSRIARLLKPVFIHGET